MQSVEFRLGEFEGPLDLLLSLIQKHKLDIHDIPILELIEQYLTVIGHVQEDNMEVASSFMEMAARLVYIKSVTLLPRHEEEAEELRLELQGQLLEYHLIQTVARALAPTYQGRQVFVRDPMVINEERPYEVKHRMESLLEAYLLSLGRKKNRLPPPQSAFSGIIKRRQVSVESRVPFVLEKLYGETAVCFSALFEDNEDSSERVATFLALLELIKNGRVLHMEETATVCLAPILVKQERGALVNESKRDG